MYTQTTAEQTVQIEQVNQKLESYLSSDSKNENNNDNNNNNNLCIDVLPTNDGKKKTFFGDNAYKHFTLNNNNNNKNCDNNNVSIVRVNNKVVELVDGPVYNINNNNNNEKNQLQLSDVCYSIVVNSMSGITLSDAQKNDTNNIYNRYVCICMYMYVYVCSNVYMYMCV